jgi:hypothetical protein
VCTPSEGHSRDGWVVDDGDGGWSDARRKGSWFTTGAPAGGAPRVDGEWISKGGERSEAKAPQLLFTASAAEFSGGVQAASTGSGRAAWCGELVRRGGLGGALFARCPTEDWTARFLNVECETDDGAAQVRAGVVVYMSGMANLR